MQSKTLNEAEDRMKKALEFVRHELAGIRTGKASPQLLCKGVNEANLGLNPTDDAKRQTADVQKMTDRYITLVDDLLKKKTAEVMEV